MDWTAEVLTEEIFTQLKHDPSALTQTRMSRALQAGDYQAALTLTLKEPHPTPKERLTPPWQLLVDWFYAGEEPELKPNPNTNS